MQNLRCSIHPAQNITNFCAREQCLVQLCATCICHHTDMHAINATLPHYQNIQQTYKKAYQIIDTQRTVIENEKKRIISYNQTWEKKKQEVYDKIKIAKRDVLQLVQHTFNELEHRHIQMVKEEEMKMGMKDGDKVIKMIEGYSTQSEKLFNLQKQLLSIRAPQALKKIYIEALPLSNNLISRISTDMSLLEAHGIRLDYIQPNLLNLKQSINNLLSLQVRYPQPIKQPELIVQETIVRQPFAQVVQARMSQSEGPLFQTCSTFYGRPQSAGKSIPGKVSYVNGRSQLLMQTTKPKISVISGRVSSPLGGSRILLKNSRRTNIFPERPVSQLR